MFHIQSVLCSEILSKYCVCVPFIILEFSNTGSFKSSMVVLKAGVRNYQMSCIIICTLPWQPLFPTLIALKGGNILGSLLYQCTLNQLKVSLGEELKSSALIASDFKFPLPKLTFNYYKYH